MLNFIPTLRTRTRLFGWAALLLASTGITGCYVANSQAPVSIGAQSQVLVSPKSWSEGIRESGSKFTCTPNSVLVGRKHYGDENDDTNYKCATLTQFGEPVTTGASSLSTDIQESNSSYVCPANNVLTGREHDDDENGNTRYRCASLIGKLGLIQIARGQWSELDKESDHSFQCPTNQVLVGREHDGDENGNTRHLCASLW